MINANKNNNGKENKVMVKESRNVIKKKNNNTNNNNDIQNIQNIQSQKTKDTENKSKRKSKITLSKKTSYNKILDNKVKNEDGSSSFGESNRKLRLIKNNNISIIEKSINEENKETEKESNNQEDINDDTTIIKSIELNQFKPQFCYTKKRENIEKILLEEAMKIILVKLDIQNLFKKICKDDPITDEENSEYDFIEMSDACKNQLRHLVAKKVRTLVI